jgi:hypothetical protein
LPKLRRLFVLLQESRFWEQTLLLVKLHLAGASLSGVAKGAKKFAEVQQEGSPSVHANRGWRKSPQFFALRARRGGDNVAKTPRRRRGIGASYLVLDFAFSPLFVTSVCDYSTTLRKFQLGVNRLAYYTH